MNNEPEIAFPYKPPSEEVKKKYRDIFQINQPLKPRLAKLIFDKIISMLFLILSSPVFLLLKVLYLIEGLFDPESRGSLIFFTML